MKLSTVERAVLLNQCRILAAVDPEGADHYEKQIEILDSGYEFLYDRILPEQEPMSSENSWEVVQILDMFSILERAVAANEPSEDVNSTPCGSEGFREMRRRSRWLSLASGSSVSTGMVNSRGEISTAISRCLHAIAQCGLLLRRARIRAS